MSEVSHYRLIQKRRISMRYASNYYSYRNVFMNCTVLWNLLKKNIIWNGWSHSSSQKYVCARAFYNVRIIVKHRPDKHISRWDWYSVDAMTNNVWYCVQERVVPTSNVITSSALTLTLSVIRWPTAWMIQMNWWTQRHSVPLLQLVCY